MTRDSDYLTHLRIVGDRMLIGVIAGCFLLTLALAPWHHTLDIGLTVGLPALLVPATLVWVRPGALVTRCAIAAALMVFSALHIQQAHGMIEMHFSVFVMLAFLLCYRDWIPLVFAAGTIAVHHIAFDILQRAGLPIWVFSSGGGLGIVLVHAAFVVFETALLIWLSLRLRTEIEAVGCEPTELSRVALALAAGNLAVDLDTSGAGERSLASAMERMRAELRATLERERSRLQENQRVRTALDRVSVGAMLVDLEGKIIYANDRASEIFRSHASEIRRSGFAPEHLIGSSFDAIHPEVVRTRSAHAGSRTTDIRMGTATLRMTANPVLDGDGKHLGTVVQWADRTQEVVAEEEIKATVAKAIAGDLTARVDETGKDGFIQTLSSGLNAIVHNMTEVVTALSMATSHVHEKADEISRSNLELSERTKQQASDLEETAASMEEMTTTVRNNAENAAHASEQAAVARDQAERGGQVVSDAVQAMNEIHAASNRIADIVGVIDEITFQINLLALNAAVEAARAGEQGRGFAVVAAEVRDLASRSAKAAKEIKALIHDSVAKVSEGTSLVNESGQVLEKIVSSVKMVTDMVAAIAQSSREQASGIEQVNKTVASMDEHTQQNAAMVEEASAAAQALSGEAAGLTQLIGKYRVDAPDSHVLKPRSKVASAA